GSWSHPDAHDDDISRQNCTTFERDVFRADCGCGLAEMEHDAVLLVDATDEVTVFVAEHALERALFRCDHMDLDLACPQRGCDFEPNEARAYDERATRVLGRCNDGARIRKRPQYMDMREFRPRNIEADRLGACRQQQAVELEGVPIRYRHLPRFRI